MKIRYDPDVDAMYIRLKESSVASTKKIDKNTILDYDDKGNVIGVELLFVKENNPDFLKKVEVENIAIA